jgi:hypothetical protein
LVLENNRTIGSTKGRKYLTLSAKSILKLIRMHIDRKKHKWINIAHVIGGGELLIPVTKPWHQLRTQGCVLSHSQHSGQHL